MIEVNQSSHSLKIYARRASFADVLKPTLYTGYKGTNKTGFIVEIRKTLLIDLTQDEDGIMSGCKSNTRNEIRRGVRDGYIFKSGIEPKDFVPFYNDFAHEKGLTPISLSDISKYSNCEINAVLLNDKVLTMHANIIDDEEKIVRLLYSASVRFDEKIDPKTVGVSNRFLHYQEFVHYHNEGLVLYDFGGIVEDEKNVAQYRISQFKKGFGGQVADDVFMKSFLFAILSRLKGFIHRH